MGFNSAFKGLTYLKTQTYQYFFKHWAICD